MLINFRFENWMSFRDTAAFSMIAGDDDIHRQRVQFSEKNNLQLLPVAAIQGGNASGKSNFVKALRFAKNLVTDANHRENGIPCEHYLMDGKYEKLPTKFSFELLIDDRTFAYDFAVTRDEVISETLGEIVKNERINVYEIKNGGIEVQEDFEHEKHFREFYHIKKKSDLFLTMISKVSNIEMPVYDWFRSKLRVFSPTTKFKRSRLYSDEMLLQTVNNALETLDCGASKIGFTDYSPSEDELAFFNVELDHKSVAYDSSKQIFAHKDKGMIITKKLVSYHKSDKGELVRFDVRKESDGTIRVFDLLPAFINLTQTGKGRVLVLDEFDRSLHTHLVQDMIKAYLDNCSKDSKSQLIFTTHNALLMDESILRCDEMWLTKRDKSGSSTMYSISDFDDLHLEKNIRESYLLGRFGGIPDMLLIENQLKMPDEEIEP